MRVAIVYNRENKNVINLFGAPNQERIGLQTIKRVVDALKKGGHQVIALEGDKDLIDKLEDFMPRVVKGERPGMVFNVSYGIQGQARYTHVPSILEMVGIPYVGSGPLAHSLALDKVVTKMILRQNGLPTPDFAVLNTPDEPVPELRYPMIVKPKSEAVSFGLKVVHSEEELRESARVIFNKYHQPVLVEQYIDGREINVGLLGNNPPEILPPVELIFTAGGPKVYTYEDKTGRSGRSIEFSCPPKVSEKILGNARDCAARAFAVLGCSDCARVDLRLDSKGNVYILEVNSLPSLGEHGSYTIGAQHVGLDFTALANRLIEVASARYFGTPSPPELVARAKNPKEKAFSFITQRRADIERSLRDWTNFSSHTQDLIGIEEAVGKLDRELREIAMNPVKGFTDERNVWMWETNKGFESGILLVGHLDVPAAPGLPLQKFRQEPEWLYGSGIGSSRAPLVMMEYALRSLRSIRHLRQIPLGVLYYTDEGQDAHFSANFIQDAAGKAKQVLVLRPGGAGNSVITSRRGQRRYRFTVEGRSERTGRRSRRPETLNWMWSHLERFSKFTSRKDRFSVSTLDIKTERVPMLLPHRATATLLMTYLNKKLADDTEKKMREPLTGNGFRWELDCISDRPPLKERTTATRLAKSLEAVAKELEIPLTHEPSIWPSVAGLVSAKTSCVCGIGPVARDLYTPNEAVQRISLIQRTLLLAQFLIKSFLKS